MKITDEKQILDEAFRRAAIAEFESAPNVARKAEAYKRYLIYKDQTKDFVREKLLMQFDYDTVREMEFCLSNISMVRKVIDKLARVYNGGVSRTVPGSTEQTAELQKLERVLKFNSAMKKANKFLKLQKNCAVYVKPCPVKVDGLEKYEIKVEPLNPYTYDVIADADDPERPLVYVLSGYNAKVVEYVSSGDAATAGRTSSAPQPVPVNRGVNPTGFKDSHGIEQAVSSYGVESAHSPDARNGTDPALCAKNYIWWSGSYHFTTNEKGEIVNSEVREGQDPNANPLGELPFVNFAIDQDGEFWAIGGDDLADAGVLVNAMITNVLNVGIVQGYGQFWMKGEQLPRGTKVGPTKAILMQFTKEQAEPDLGFASANPQLDQLKNLVEMYIALILTTNNLSTSGVASSLSGASPFPSGIAMVIDKSESQEDVQDQAQIFKDNEPAVWRKILGWSEVYKNDLAPGFKEVTLPKDAVVETEFRPMEPITTESERLDNLKKRQELKLNTELELIMKDRGCTEEQAREVLKKILEERMEKQAEAVRQGLTPEGQPVPGDQQDPQENAKNEDDQGDGKPGSADGNDPGAGAEEDSGSSET